MILVDTGPLVAAANKTDRHHEESVLALSQIRGPRLVPGPVIAETCHLRAREADAQGYGLPVRLHNVRELT